MSYEKDIPRKVKCPCGDGYVICESESNDWGQVRDHEPYIDCLKCKMCYDLLSESYLAKFNNVVKVYYLVKKDTNEKIKLDL